MAKTFVTLLTEFIAANDKKILDNPDRFKSLFLDFSQNQCRTEAMIFSQFLASPQAAELKNTDYADSAVLKNQAERFNQAYMFEKSICELMVNAYAQVLGLDEKKPESAAENTGIICPNCGFCIINGQAVDGKKIKKAAKDFQPDNMPTINNFKLLLKNKKFKLIAGIVLGIIGITLIGIIGYSRFMDRGNMVFIKGGTFTMGSPAAEVGHSSNETQRQVTLSSFYMGKYEVTQAEYEEVMGRNLSYNRGPNLPVENVSWFDATEYCNKLSQQEGLTPVYTISGSENNRTVTWDRNANGYRLPTEAEWEYACRAGTTTAYNTGNSITESQAHFNTSRSAPVGSYLANAWGLYDMHGNVLEWCWDWYGWYPNGAQTDPIGAVSGSNRVLRGGSWSNAAVSLRSAGQRSGIPSIRAGNIGFRVTRNAQ